MVISFKTVIIIFQDKICFHLIVLFRRFYRMVVPFVVHTDQINLILAISSSRLLM